MRIIKRKYPIKPIDIQISDNGKYADMAYLFDRYDVLEDIARLRKSWVGVNLIPNKELDNLINKFSDPSCAAEERNHFWDNFHRQIEIARKYNLGRTYIRPIGAATLSGIITDKDYTTILVEDANIPEFLQLNEKIAYTFRRIRAVDFVNPKKDSRSISTVKRDRKWYWMYQKMGYRKIAKITGQPLETVRTAINSYHSKLFSYYHFYRAV